MFSFISFIIYLIGLFFGIRGIIQYFKDKTDIRAPWNLFYSMIIFDISSFFG